MVNTEKQTNKPTHKTKNYPDWTGQREEVNKNMLFFMQV